MAVDKNSRFYILCVASPKIERRAIEKKKKKRFKNKNKASQLFCCT